jgi:hypothetical protein
LFIITANLPDNTSQLISRTLLEFIILFIVIDLIAIFFQFGLFITLFLIKSFKNEKKY